MGERFERLEETLQICAQMWDPHNNGPFAGTHYQLARRCVHRAVAAISVHSAIVTPTTGSPAKWIEGMAPAVARLADLG
jgi:hypothetical protein